MSKWQVIFEVSAIPIFVNFGATPHYLGLCKKGHWLKKKYTTAIVAVMTNFSYGSYSVKIIVRLRHKPIKHRSLKI